MAKLPKAFKRKDHETMRDFSAIPAGEYVAKVSKADYVENSKKNGHILKLTFTVQNKAHKGANVFANLNLDNPSEKAVEIAESELATICDAIGKTVIKDTNELMGKIMIIKVDNKEDQNNIKMYAPLPSEESDLDDDDDDLDDDNTPDTDDDDDDDADEVSADDVVELATKYKKLTSMKQLKEVLGEYDISKTKEIADLEEDDLESLKEDLEEAIEEEE